MTFWIMPEFDRDGWGVCLFWLQGGKDNETPTDKIKPSHGSDLVSLNRSRKTPAALQGGMRLLQSTCRSIWN